MPRRLLLPLIALCLLAPLPAAADAPEILADVSAEQLNLVFPQDPETTWFLDTYGARRDTGRVHVGIDLHAPKGSPVYAVAPGVVMRVSISRRPGAYVAVDHGGGWSSWYMHLDTDDPGTDNGRGGYESAIASGIEVGSFVDAGALIGFVGDSGNAEGTVPHTHFELHRNGRPIDPYWLLVESHERAKMELEAQRLEKLLARLS